MIPCSELPPALVACAAAGATGSPRKESATKLLWHVSSVLVGIFVNAELCQGALG